MKNTFKKKKLKEIMDKKLQTVGAHIAEKTDIASLVVSQNSNTLVIGSAGSGKNWFYTRPEIQQCSGSFVVSDPHGMFAEEYAPELKKRI